MLLNDFLMHMVIILKYPHLQKKIIKYLKKKFIDTNLKATTYNFNLAAISYFYVVCFEKEFNSKILPKAKLAKKLPSIIEKDTFIKLINKEKISNTNVG